MRSHDKIATRLAQILNKLNMGEKIAIQDLVEEFNVTKRTIQRDLNERLSYLPLKKENNLYFLEEYYLGKLNFKDIEHFATLSGIKELYPNLDEDFLKNILDNTVNQAYLIKGHNYEDISQKLELFKEIENAINKQNILKFEYKDKQRVVNPYKLLNTKGIWYLVAVEDGKIKSFSFTKILKLSLTTKPFKLDEKVVETIEDEDNVWFGANRTEVVLQVDKSVAGYFSRRDILPNQNIIKKLEDGGLLVSSKVSFDEEILKLVRYWIPNVKIVSPNTLQEKLERNLLEYLK